jgi:hypothetical protein
MGDDGNIQGADIRVPGEDGELLVHPPVEELGNLLRENIRLQESWKTPSFASQDFQQMARDGRSQLVDAAWQYSRRYRAEDSLPKNSDHAPVILSGHQPGLVHPGVWFKNFLLCRLAEAEGATPINLLIDNDIQGDGYIQVPSGDAESPRLATVAIDQLDEPVPYEEWSVVDREMLLSFPARVAEAGRNWLRHPLLDDLWKHVIEGVEETQNVGQLLARARHLLESDLGLKTLELPFSEICQFPAFRLFSAMLIQQARQFREVHNDSLAEYRKARRIRSRSHPFPELTEDSDWQEIPFWIWTSTVPRRRRAYTRVENDRIMISDLEETCFSLPELPAGQEDDILVAFEHVEQEGIRFRPRAVVTTMFSRLVLSDIFLHGVGGAHYDRLTDVIIERFFGIPAPGFVVASATFLLPLQLPPVSEEEVSQVRQQLRDSEFSPDAYLASLLENKQLSDFSDIEQIQSLIKDKQLHVHQQVDPQDRPAWHQKLQQLNEQLAAHAAPYCEQLHELLAQREQQLDQKTAFCSREFPFCLFPAETLFPQLLAFAGKPL